MYSRSVVPIAATSGLASATFGPPLRSISAYSSRPSCDVDGTCYCPLTDVIEALSRKSAIQLVSVVGAHDSDRFAEIEACLPPASTDTLSKRLDEWTAFMHQQIDGVEKTLEPPTQK